MAKCCAEPALYPADLVALRVEEDGSIRLCLVHCKNAHEGRVSGDIRNFYALCGQAQKSVAVRHARLKRLYHDLRRRIETGYATASRFLKDDLKLLSCFKERSANLSTGTNWRRPARPRAASNDFGSISSIPCWPAPGAARTAWASSSGSSGRADLGGALLAQPSPRYGAADRKADDTYVRRSSSRAGTGRSCDESRSG
jgi:hypothetical protein